MCSYYTNLPITVLLESSPSVFEVDTLINMYATCTNIMETLNKKLTLSLLTFNSKNLDSFHSYVVNANKNFLGKGCFLYYTPCKCAKEAALRGDFDLFKLALERHPKDSKVSINWEAIGINAASCGNMDILNMAISKDVDAFSIISGAAKGGQLEIFKESLKIKFEDSSVNRQRYCNFLLLKAGMGGCMDIIEILLDYGADDWSHLASGAAMSGNTKIFRFALDKGVKDWNHICIGIGSGNSLDLLQFLPSCHINWETIARGSCHNLELFKFAYEKINIIHNKNYFWKSISIQASSHGQLEVLKLALSHLLTCNRQILKITSLSSGNLEVIAYVKAYKEGVSLSR